MPTENGLSTADRDNLEILRSKFGDELPEEYDSDLTLLHWLTYWDNNHAEIISHIKAAVVFRRAFGLDKVPTETPTEFLKYLESNYEIATNYFPGGLTGVDHQGNVLAFEPLGRIDPRGMLCSSRVSQFLRARMAETERVWQGIKRQERLCNRKCGLMYVMDLEGMSMDQIWMPSFHIYMSWIMLMQDHYPDLIYKIMVINAPTIVNFAYKLIYPALSSQLRQKIKIYRGGHWQEKVAKLADPEQIPVFWGGTQKGPKDSPYGTIRMAGKVPAELKYDPKKNPEYEPAPDDLKEVQIARGDKFQMEIAVEENGVLQWYFRLRPGDIYFGIFRLNDSEQKEVVVPVLRLNAEYVPEYGRIQCPKAGTYLIVMDNSHSMIRSKTAQYCITVK